MQFIWSLLLFALALGSNPEVEKPDTKDIDEFILVSRPLIDVRLWTCSDDLAYDESEMCKSEKLATGSYFIPVVNSIKGHGCVVSVATDDGRFKADGLYLNTFVDVWVESLPFENENINGMVLYIDPETAIATLYRVGEAKASPYILVLRQYPDSLFMSHIEELTPVYSNAVMQASFSLKSGDMIIGVSKEVVEALPEMRDIVGLCGDLEPGDPIFSVNAVRKLWQNYSKSRLTITTLLVWSE